MSYMDEEERRRQESRSRIASSNVQNTPLAPAAQLQSGMVGGSKGPLGQLGNQLKNKAISSIAGAAFGPLGGLASMFFNNGGYAGWQRHAQGTDSVPAVLTPGEAVIPAPAAQDPANKPHIDAMINQGRQMNDGTAAPSPMEMGAPAVGPLSGKTKREEMKLMQDMSLKKKSWMADEERKNELHRQKLEDMKKKSALAARQSQE